MEQKVNDLHQKIKEIFPDAISVNIFVNAKGIEVIPNFKTNVKDCSIQNISGKWVNTK